MKRHRVARFILDFEKEEKWLNEMSAKGLHLISYCFPQYVFEEGEPGEYTYRVELLSHSPTHPESKAYIAFAEETGVECVDTMFWWAYFRKKTSDGPLELYSDWGSKVRHYKRIAALVGVVATFNAASAVYLALLSGSAAMALPNTAVTLTLSGLLLSYLKRARKVKAAAKIRE